jgi:hypothetical protein
MADHIPVVLFSREIPDTAPEDPAFASVTHLLLIEPTQSVDLPASTILSPTNGGGLSRAPIVSLQLPITDIRLESLLVHLRAACNFIDGAVKSGGTVLVHCLLETRTAQVICAYCTCTIPAFRSSSDSHSSSHGKREHQRTSCV